MHFFAYSQEMHSTSWNRQALASSAPAAPEVDVISLGRRVRHLRKAAGLTLDDLSAAVGTAPSQGPRRRSCTKPTTFYVVGLVV